MNVPLKEIRIVDLDVELTQPSYEGPGFRRLYLKLSEEPPAEWVKMFELKRRFPSPRVWRNAWVVGPHIVIECIPEELEQSQLDHLCKDVAEANKEYSEHAAARNAESLQQSREQAKVRKQLEELRRRLKFD